MGFKDKFDELKEKGKGAAREHGDKLEKGLDKGKDFANEKTGGKHSERLDRESEKAQEYLREQQNR